MGTKSSPPRDRRRYRAIETPPPGPAWLRRFVGDEPFLTPARVVLRGPEVTDEFIAEHLSFMTSVEDLDLVESSNVTDAAMSHIASMRDLHWLTLDCPRLTDVALEDIASLRELYRLTLNCPHLTDAALPHIAALPKLGGLVLNCRRVTASGIHQLEPLKHLESVSSFRNLDNRHAVRSLELPRGGNLTTGSLRSSESKPRSNLRRSNPLLRYEERVRSNND